MTHPAIPLLLLSLTVPATVSMDRPAQGDEQRIELAQLTIHQRIVIRIPRMPSSTISMTLDAQPIQWEEKHGPKCLAMRDIAGAVTHTDSVDIVMDNGERYRARLGNDCPALDFYSGFYFRPTKDGKMCADRDDIRSRSGATCPIDKFRKLVAKR